jgi:hypothetical protein
MQHSEFLIEQDKSLAKFKKQQKKEENLFIQNKIDNCSKLEKDIFWNGISRILGLERTKTNDLFSKIPSKHIKQCITFIEQAEKYTEYKRVLDLFVELFETKLEKEYNNFLEENVAESPFSHCDLRISLQFIYENLNIKKIFTVFKNKTQLFQKDLFDFYQVDCIEEKLLQMQKVKNF